jgi:hypothetical protein
MDDRRFFDKDRIKKSFQHDYKPEGQSGAISLTVHQAIGLAFR